MPTTTADQQIPLPVDADTADNPTAFNSQVVVYQQRLVRVYTDEADRTARMLVLQEGNLSALQDTGRLEWYNGTNHVSGYTHSLRTFTRTSGTQNVGPSNTTLQDVTSMVAPLPGIAGAIFGFRGVVFYDSSTAADIKFAFTIPAGATMEWGGVGLATAAGGVSGDTTRPSTTVSGTALLFGAAGVGTGVWMDFAGEITLDVTAGNLQLQAAQNSSDATNTTIHARSRMEVWRIS